MIRIETVGSFRPRRNKNFSASEHGHVNAVRRAITWLRKVALPDACRQDQALLQGGHEPEAGFLEADRRWMHAYGSPLGEQVPLIERLARDIAGDIDDALPPGWIFSAQFFSVGEKGAMSYISTGRREDMIAALRELIGKLEGGDGGTLGKAVKTE